MKSALQSRRRYALCVVLVAGLLGTGVANRADASDPRAQLAALRREIDDVANKYFAAQQTARRLDGELADLRSRIAAADTQRLAVRGRAIDAATALYRLSARSMDEAPSSILDSARSAVFLESASRREQARIEQYAQASSRLRDAQRELALRRGEQSKVVQALEQQTRELERRLGEAQRAYQQMLTDQANAAAAAAAARTSTTQSRVPGQPTPTTRRPTTTTRGGSNGNNGGGGPKPVDPPPPPAGTNQHHNDPFLSCVRHRESRGFYGAVNSAGYYGAYQFAIRTWNVTASHAGRPQLIGVRPDRASAWDQDELAWVLYQWQGKGPWGGSCS